MKRIILHFQVFLICIVILSCGRVEAYCQELTSPVAGTMYDSIQVSLLTCQPHDEVYSLYGHTAIRIEDPSRGYDVAVNYGVFDFNTDNFVLKFVFGKTDYMMGIFDFKDFLYEYRYWGSGVYQQHIDLTTAEKAVFMHLLAENAKPQNVVYRYNFYYNNCTTRARDIIFSCLDSIIAPPHRESTRTFRQLIHTKNGEHRWSRFGNDILLGVGSDKMASMEEAEFLPEELMQDFDSMLVKRHDGSVRALVDTAFWVLPPGVARANSEYAGIKVTPSQCAWAFLCAIMAYLLASIALQRKNNAAGRKWIGWLDYAVCCLYAATGIPLVLMIFSEHPTVSLNLQLLLFCPLWFLTAFPRKNNLKGWGIMAVVLILFFAGNAIQQYAEGVNVLALSLSAIVGKNIWLSQKKC